MPQKAGEVQDTDQLPPAKYYRDRAARCSKLSNDPSLDPEMRESYLRMARSYLLMGKDVEGRRKKQGKTRGP